MAEDIMPAAEATNATFDERNAYEFAFHVLPTVAEGEVAGVLERIKSHITSAGAEVTSLEAPERIELVYPVVKHMEGKNRRFLSAYFGWIRFKLEADKLESLRKELEHDAAILRSLMIKLTKVEELSPFRFHEHRKSLKMVAVVEEDPEILKEVKTESEEGEVSEAALEESLEKITEDETKA